MLRHMTHIGLVTVVVGDYDEATAFYVDALGFELVEDTRLDDEKRWVVAAPRGSQETRVAVFQDLYGNRWDLLQPATPW